MDNSWQKPGVDREKSDNEQTTERMEELERHSEDDRDSKIGSQQDSDVPAGRENRVRRLPARFGIDEFINEYKYCERLRAWLFPVNRVAWSNAYSPFVLICRTDRMKYSWLLSINPNPQLLWYDTPQAEPIGESVKIFQSFTCRPK